MSEKDIYTRKDEKRFTLRIDKGTFETIAWCAKKHKRSIGKEIEFAIDFYLDDLAMQGLLNDDSRSEDDPYTSRVL